MTESAKDLPPDAEQQLHAHAAAGREAWRERGDLAEAERQFLLAWDTIPSPKIEWDWSGSLAGGFLSFYLETGQPRKALAWLPRYEELYGDAVDLHMWQGMVHYELGELEVAFAAFRRAHDAFGYRPFREEDPRYWQFYRGRAASGGAAAP